MPKVARKPLILGRFGTMATKLLNLYCGVHLVESYCKESNITDIGRDIFHVGMTL